MELQSCMQVVNLSHQHKTKNTTEHNRTHRSSRTRTIFKLLQNRPIQWDAVTLLLEKHPEAAKRKDSMGRTPLHLACLYDAPLEV
eukprot:3010970-Ditylum_brightwellii.AAC.1